MSKQWSVYQKAIFGFVTDGTGNAVVEAVAGSGKSTTIVECVRLIPQHISTLMLAFNKTIAEELKARGVNARTFHSLTYSAVTRHKNVRTIDSDKLRKLVDSNLKGTEAFIYGTFLVRLVGLGRQAGIGCLIPDIEMNWLELVSHHDLELEHEDADLGRAIELASEVLTLSNNSNSVDFDDLLYLAVKDGLVLPKFDFVFVDEAQDTNAIQRALIRKILKPTSRIIAVGDPAQAIYGFRGANSDSLDLIAEEFNCIKLPLTVSYRCPLSVVKHAKQWVDHIEAAPDAPEGEVIHMNQVWKTSDFSANDLVVCRSTKPLVSLGYQLLRDRVPVHIMGREIGAGLKRLISKMNAKSLEELDDKLAAYTEREVQKAIAAKQDAKVDAIQDKTDAVMCLLNSLPETDRTITALMNVIDTLFADANNVVTLATIHKAKGLEADTVFWLNSSACPAAWAKQPWQRQQEVNLCYVATTRAKNKLILIEEKTHNERGDIGQ